MFFKVQIAACEEVVLMQSSVENSLNTDAETFIILLL